MKTKILSPFIFFCFFIVSCKNNESMKSSSGINIDSLINKNEKNTKNVTESSKKSDTLITTKVDKTVEKIGKLENEIQELKEENNELKNNLNDANDVGKPFRNLPVSND